MTDYKITDWELTNIPDEEIDHGDSANKTFVEGGLKTVKITSAVYINKDAAEKESEQDTYRLTIECLEGGLDAGAKATLTYWLKNKDRGTYNSNVLGTMKSLGKAVFGNAFSGSVPAPSDIVGAVVMADIKFGKPNANGQSFPRVYQWSPAPQEFGVFSDLSAQYYREINDSGGQN
ncbi:MAG: hypothetical protein IIY21_04390 [Clostridiales bacterium]|nr:hypothetical protein [Clostridiales bacterium]MBQ1573875.1 hypothetical protein [Clostridiales bacterium]